MPLPLPNLDTRTWADLVDEGRALIPRYAPSWTDHNVHDPGIALIELLAWLAERDSYRINRVPARHRRKFLDLIGFSPVAPRASRVVLAFQLRTAALPQALPAGLTVATGNGATGLLRFRTLAPVQVIAAAIQAVQSFDGAAYSDQTRFWREGVSFLPWGPNPSPPVPPDPSRQPALYLGFDQALPPSTPVSLWLQLAGPRADQAERWRIVNEAQQQFEACQPVQPGATCVLVPLPVDPWCPPEDDTGGSGASGTAATPSDSVPAHHSIRTAWDYYDGAGWQPLDPGNGDVLGDTRGFTLDGAVQITLPGPMGSVSVGSVSSPLFYLRCRLIAGPPDAAPSVQILAANAVLAAQTTPARGTYRILPGVTPPAGKEPTRGTTGKLSLGLDEAGNVTALALDPAEIGPEVFVIDYQPATASAPGTLVVTLALLGRGTGRPDLRVSLPGAPVADGRIEIWTLGPSGWLQWCQRPDFDASSRVDADVTLAATIGEVAFGNGERGRVAPALAWIFAAYDVTLGAAGNVATGVSWRLAGADDALNGALLGGDPAIVAAALQSIANPAPADGGADEEDLDHAAGRAAAALWAHERLVELCPLGSCDTLDQLPRADVLARLAPWRATTALDFERLSLDVPGTRVARARAWAGIDPDYPCLKAPGTVSVVIVPELPLGLPRPTPGLLGAVHRYLDRRRVVGTRLVVVGPRYLQVSVQAQVSARVGARPNRVNDDVVAALNTFLDPLAGGRDGRGWPFGRDVYRSEILDVIGGVSGVDHVDALELIPDSGEAQCANLCVPPTWLVTPGTHTIQVT